VRHHEWRDENEDGEKRRVRASIHGGRWRVQTRLKSEDRFTVVDPIPMEILHTLREVLADKYRWGKAPYEHLVALDALIENGGVPPRKGPS
jgi:hypothetical protein